MPTYKKAVLQAFEITELEAKKYEKEIISVLLAAEEDINKRLQDFFNNIDAKNLKKNEVYIEAVKFGRLNKLHEYIKNKLVEDYKQVENSTIAAVDLRFSNEYYRKLFVTSFAFSNDVFIALNPVLTEAVVYGVQDSVKKINKKIFKNPQEFLPKFGTLSELVKSKRDEAIKQITEEINIGLINGESYAKTAKRVKEVIGNAERGQGYKALRIVRTEGHRASAAADYAAAQEMDNAIPDEIKRKWDATLDSKTRAAHQTADGQEVGVNEPFNVGGELLMFPGGGEIPKNNINCRCVDLLIIDGVTPNTRIARDPYTGENETIGFQNFEEWAKSKGAAKNKNGKYVFKKKAA